MILRILGYRFINCDTEFGQISSMYVSSIVGQHQTWAGTTSGSGFDHTPLHKSRFWNYLQKNVLDEEHYCREWLWGRVGRGWGLLLIKLHRFTPNASWRPLQSSWSWSAATAWRTCLKGKWSYEDSLRTLWWWNDPIQLDPNRQGARSQELRSGNASTRFGPNTKRNIL